MRNRLREHWPGLLAVAVVLAANLIDLAPDVTWINTDADGPHYVYSAKYLMPAHKTSAPLFLLLGHVFLWIPYGTEFWRMGLMSVIATAITAWYVYLLTRHYAPERGRSMGAIAAFCYGTSALVLSQGTIVETYALVTMFGVAGWYYALKGRWGLTAAMFGAGGAVHHLIAFPLIAALVAFRPFRQWRYILTMAGFLMFYLYLPVTNRPPYMWHQPNASLAGDFLADNGSTLAMLGGGLSIWDLPKRLLDAGGLVLLSMPWIVAAIWTFRQHRALMWLTVLPIVYYVSNLAPQTYVYVIAAVPFATVAAFAALAHHWRFVKRYMLTALVVFSGMTVWAGDIGRTLDPEMSAVKFRQELDRIPDGDILLAQQGWEWAIVFPYNADKGRNITSICVGTLPSAPYRRDNLDARGIRYEVPVTDRIDTSTEIAQSIVRLNGRVWTTMPTMPRTYGATVIPARGNEWVFGEPTRPVSITDGSRDMQWQWRPSHPYDIITGAVEVTDWTYITFSNYSVMFFVMLAVVAYAPVWFYQRALYAYRKRKGVKHEPIGTV